MRALLIEYKLTTTEWPYLLPVVQANLNQTSVESLSDRAPIELFMGLQPPIALNTTAVPRGTSIEFLDEIEFVGGSAEQFLQKTRLSLSELHKEVRQIKEKERLEAMAKKGGSVCNFDVGDFVLWSLLDKRLDTYKLLDQWVGPFAVVNTKPNSFVIKHLITGSEYEVHGSRLKFYVDASFSVTEEIMKFVSDQGMLLGINMFEQHRFNNEYQRWELLVSWIGLQEIESSWEPVLNLLKDVPLKVHQYADTCGDDTFKTALTATESS